jgi:rod shape-determining protein MreD
MIIRRIIFTLVIIGLQGVMGAILPITISPPDLFLLVALFAAARIPLFLAVCVGYSLGLLQDILGAGLLGYHAAGIMAGVFASYFIRRGLSGETSFNHATTAFVALLAKWLVFLILNYWTRQNTITLETIPYRFLPEVILTLIVGPLVFSFANWAFGSGNSNNDGLL